MKYIRVVSLCLLMSLNLLSAKPASAATGSKHWTVGMSQCNLGEPWRVQMNTDIKKAAATHPEIQVIFKDAQNDTLKQRSQIEEFVSAGVDLLIISPKEAAPLTPTIREAYKKGIPVVILDRKVLGTDYTTFIGADNNKIGQAAGLWIAKHFGAKGKVAELKGLMTSTPAQERDAGFRKALKSTQMQLVYDVDMKWLEPEARKEMESALSIHPDINIVYSHNDPGAHGAYLAARAAGLEKQMAFVGIDGLPQEGQSYVKQGILAASFEYPTGGSEAIDTALKILNKQTVPKEVALRSHVYTKDNISHGGEWIN